MKITRNTLATGIGPAEWFTGNVYIDAIASPEEGSRLTGTRVHFSPSARTAWHTHATGQTIYVLEGVGRVQRRGGAVEEIRAGDRVFFEPDEEHWHGAAPDRFMVHIAMIAAPEEGPTIWGDHVTDEDYGG